MSKLLCKQDYLAKTASSRDERMSWWRDARFVHYGLYSQLGRHEWSMVHENFTKNEYEKLANNFNPKIGAPREWARLAKRAGMKYMVLTTRHHEGFSLWDSKVNPYNSMNYGPKRDIVKEFVDACREYDLKIGFYSSLMDWHHPDSYTCAYDSEARTRFLKYIEQLNRELLTNYGKIDILWFDVSRPMESPEGWNSLEMNQKLRELQPDIIINNRSQLQEDFSTPEEHIKPVDNDWEACMTFNGISWGYVDSKQAIKYSYTSNQIIRMLHTCTKNGGNLLLNIGPTPEGDVPEEVFAPLSAVGDWLNENGEAVYGKIDKHGPMSGNGITYTSTKGNCVYLCNWIWPHGGQMGLGGYLTAPASITYLKDGTPIEFTHKGNRIILKNLPDSSKDTTAGITVIKMEFDKPIKHVFASGYPQLNGGKSY